MQLDYIPDVNEYGENILRLFSFDQRQAVEFYEILRNTVVENKQKLDLSQIDFIQRHDCNLILGIFSSDEGIMTRDNKTFYCALTVEGFEEMLRRIEPFCHKETKAYRFLYELDNPTDLLFSPAGTK